MSMICHILGVSSDQITALRATPSLATDLAAIAQDEQGQARREVLMNQMAPERRKAVEAQYRAAMERIPGANEIVLQKAAARARLGRFGPVEQALSLEKSWHILHYLFTGDIVLSKAPDDALLTGEELGDDLGYGPARLHNEKETHDFARYLKTLDLPQLQERVSYREMSRIGVYSMPMGQRSDAEYDTELREEVASYFPQLQEYVVKMAEKGNGLLMWLS